MIRQTGLYLLVALYMGAGLNHFWHPHFYLSIIPPYLPFHDAINKVSGICEIVFGLMVLFPGTRRAGVYAIIAMLIAFIPAHVYVMQQNPTFYNNPMQFMLGLVRLFIIHPFFIAWAWWYRNDKSPAINKAFES